jgi:hypothetical protein
MENDDELALKVDALIRKNAAIDAIEDRNIPLLTDMIEGLDLPTLQPQALSPAPASAAAPPPSSNPAPPSILKRMNDDEIDELSHDIFLRVTERMDRELAGKLEARLTHEINAKVRVAVANVLIDMRQTIANEIGDAVNAALADKLR